MELQARGILLDIEGTTSSIRFVYDQMFPFVRRELSRFLAAHHAESSVVESAERIAHDAGYSYFAELCEAKGMPQNHVALTSADARQVLHDEVIRQMDSDLKSTGLKQLQGLIWKSGFNSGELRAHLYPEVAECLRSWHAAGFVLRIYSSGSVNAQKLFFGHTLAGDLLPLFSGHDDTTTGSKKEPASYAAIAQKFGFAPEEIVFVSDSIEELQAAASAGMQVVWSCRPENPLVNDPPDFPTIQSFTELQFARLPHVDV